MCVCVVFVSLMTMFNVSQVWDVAHSNAYCNFVEHKVIEWYVAATQVHAEVMGWQTV